MRMRNILLIGCVVSGMAHSGAPVPYTFPSYSGDNDATTTNTAVRDYTKSGEDINNNLTRPMMSTDPITTFDGSTFSAQMACPSSQAYLELLIAPGGSGDITTFNLQQDTDLDGSYDYMYSPSFGVSGICANGIISCEAGTWNNCQAYQWNVSTTTKQATLIATGLSALGGCYCVNNSCGASLVMTHLSSTLGDLAGGVVAKLSSLDPTFSISKVDVAGPVITYYGQNSGDCGMIGTGGQESFFSDPVSMPAVASSTATLDSMFNLVSTSAAATDSDYTKRACTVSRTIGLDEVTLDDIIMYNGGSGSISTCGMGCMQLVLGTVGDNYWGGTCSLNKHDVSFWVSQPERIISATIINAQFDDHIQISDNDTLLYAHDSAWTDTDDASYPPSTFWFPLTNPPTPYCERGTSWNVNPGVDFTRQIKVPGAHNFKIRVAVSEGGEGYAYAQVMVDEACYLRPEVVTNTCTVYETDDRCRLAQETVDGVEIYRNFNPTGLIPLPNTKTIVGSICTKNVEKPWWLKERVYHCNNTRSFDFTNVFERSERIRTTATASGYDDYRLDESTGEWIEDTANTLAMPTLTPVAPCIQACKTAKTIEANDVAGLGVTEDNRTMSTTIENAYYECNAEGVCPAGTDEIITTACQCMNNFAEATAIMQSMRLAGRDMICTSGVPSPLE